jgi:hypothetical protein
MPDLFVFCPDGTLTHQHFKRHVPLEALQRAVGGLIEALPEAFHQLPNATVWINEDGLHALEVNRPGSRAIGLDLSRYAPLCGPIAVVRGGAHTTQPEREHQTRFFAALEHARRGDASELRRFGYRFVIDGRTG